MPWRLQPGPSPRPWELALGGRELPASSSSRSASIGKHLGQRLGGLAPTRHKPQARHSLRRPAPEPAPVAHESWTRSWRPRPAAEKTSCRPDGGAGGRELPGVAFTSFLPLGEPWRPRPRSPGHAWLARGCPGRVWAQAHTGEEGLSLRPRIQHCSAAETDSPALLGSGV